MSESIGLKYAVVKRFSAAWLVDLIACENQSVFNKQKIHSAVIQFFE